MKIKCIFFKPLILLALISCVNKNENLKVDKKEIKSIISAVIKSEMIEDKSSKGYVLNKLEKSQIILPQESDTIYAHSRTVQIETLKKCLKITNKTDSIFVISQNENPTSFFINLKDSELITFFDIEQIEKYETFYIITIPILNSAGNLAYIESNYYCGGLCGGGKAIILTKECGIWKIKEKFGTWIS